MKCVFDNECSHESDFMFGTAVLCSGITGSHFSAWILAILAETFHKFSQSVHTDAGILS